MIYTPSFRLRSFDSISNVKKFGVMKCLLEGLIMANVAYLLDHPETPALYNAGVRYLAEPDGVDEWQDIPDTLVRMSGDCEDLASWRIAELRVRSRVHAQPWITVQDLPSRSGELVRTYHITVIHPTGAKEDPSRLLGMR